MEPTPQRLLLRARLVELSAQSKKLGEENLQLRTDLQIVLDRQRELRSRLLGNVTNNKIHFDASFHRAQPSSMEGTFADLSRMLIEAQEQERARIGRELHDDINQRVALLAIVLEEVHRDLYRAPASELDHRMRELKQQVIDLGRDIHGIAHELHCSTLEYLGFVPALRKLARELGERHGIKIEIRNYGVPDRLPAEISLCLLRIVQEGFHNSARHSGTKRIKVHLQKSKDQICLIISDSGKGFDVAAIPSGQGLGLVSMRERIRLLNGKIAIHSEPELGTRVQAWVPLQGSSVPRTSN
jgi:signal transduction histidine kinase